MMFLYTLDVIGILFYFIFILSYFIPSFHFFLFFYLLYYTTMLWVIISHTLMFWVINLRSCGVINLVFIGRWNGQLLFFHLCD